MTVCFVALIPKPVFGEPTLNTTGDISSETRTLIVDKLKLNSPKWETVLDPLLSQREKQIAEEARKRAEEERRVAEANRPVAQPAPAKPAAALPSGSCQDWMVAAGVTDMANAYTLIMRESGCRPDAVNRSSGACGIPQALPCSKLGTGDPVEQIRWMQNYVVRRYGSWAGAVSWHNSHNWY